MNSALLELQKALDSSSRLGFAVRALATTLAVAAVVVALAARSLSSAYARLKAARHFDLDGTPLASAQRVRHVTDDIAHTLFLCARAHSFFCLAAYVREPEPPFKSKAKVVIMHWFNVGSHVALNEAHALAELPSDHMPGLRVTLRAGSPPALSAPACGASAARSLVVGTIRMGFGHHRIAYATASWGVASGRDTYFHDLLAIDSAESSLIKETDKLYSMGSRLASELGGAVERMWGGLTKSGDADALRVTYQMAEHLRPLLLAFDRDTPIIATHCLVGLLAVACGFTNVINLVIDNHAQWFIVVPGALNLVQGPSNYHSLLRMGVPPSKLKLVGAWVPKPLVDGIPADCAARIARAKDRANSPLRVLLPVGGAGAQRSFICNLVAALMPEVRAGRVQLLLNAGDHAHMRDAFTAALEAGGGKRAANSPPDGLAFGSGKGDGPAGGADGVAYATVTSMDGVLRFCDGLRAGRSPAAPVILFTFAEYFPAVAATDQLCRVTDVLACKPSELAFYPVPKLMIRRVGDHEAYSAMRASEMGDGTLEARELPDALAYVRLFGAEGGDLAIAMNEAIIKNNQIGIYSGCQHAVELAIKA